MHSKRRTTTPAACLRAGALACVLAGAMSTAQASTWLTLRGEPDDAANDIVEVNPESIDGKAEMRTMQVRVSRAQQRTSRDGVVFRSYFSVVEFDCTKGTARFLSADFYRLPMWQGTVHQSLIYGRDQVRPMVFREMTPNPTERIIRAACKSGDVLSN